MPFSPLGTVPRFAAENRRANLALVGLLRQLADRLRATPAQIALFEATPGAVAT